MSGEYINRGVAFTWFTPVLALGVQRKLGLNDLPEYPAQFHSEECKKRFQDVDSKSRKRNSVHVSRKGNAHHGYKKLVSAIRRKFGISLLKTGFLKILNLVLSFSGPILLGYIVAYLEDGVTKENLMYGMFLVLLLTIRSLVTIIINVNYSIRCAMQKIELQATLTRIVFSRSILQTTIAWSDLKLSSAQINNLIQVDVEQVSDNVKNIHDLWALPVQIIITFVLLYLQIKVAFLAGVAVIVVMVPFNAYIAKKIGSNTAKLLVEKDARVKLVGEAFQNICSLKMSGLESSVLSSSLAYRAKEAKYLAIRKYLDAICVIVWVSMPVIIPFVTFSVTVLVGTPLTASDVITALALLNMLLFPMNAYPWVINGFMEARVSARRLAHVLLSEDGSRLVLYNRIIDNENYVDYSAALGGSNTPIFKVEDVHYAWNSDADVIQSLALTDVEEQKHVSGDESVNSPLVRESSVGENKFTVTTNDLECTSGQLWAVVGSTGSGKTALLLGMLGELYKVGGFQSGNFEDQERLSHMTDNSVSARYGRPDEQKGFKMDNVVGSATSAVESSISDAVHSGRVGISYCAQLPPLHSGSIRSNILMGSAYDPVWYKDVIKGCCLAPDLMASNLTNGDLSDVGAAGSNLSGGQRLRVGIARALYSHHRVVILDDPFSALDATTGEQLMNYLRTTICQLQGRIVILSTHSISLLTEATGIIVLRHGIEVQRGTFDSLKSSCNEFKELSDHSKVSLSDRTEIHKVDDKELSKYIVAESGNDVADMIVNKTIAEQESKAKADLEDSSGKFDSSTTQQQIEAMSAGKIRSRVFKSYLQYVGVCLTLTIVLFTFLTYATSIAMALWLAYWATHQDDYTRMEFVLISTGIVVLNIIFAILRAFLFAKGGLNACSTIYTKLTSAVFNTNISFFENTAIGRLTNRFGKDTNVIDDQLPFIMNSLLAQFFMMVGGTFVMAFNDPLIILFLLIVAVFQYRLQKFYRESSRELRRLDSVYRSPVYTIFTECMNNAVTIRSLGSICLRYYDKQLSKSLDNSLRVTMCINVAAQWLSTRLQLMGAVINTALALMIVLNDLYRIMPVSAGLAGLSLIYSFSIVSNMNSLVNAFAETEQEMISVERVLEYCRLESEFNEETDDSEEKKTPSLWSILYSGLMNARLPRQGYQSFNGTLHHADPHYDESTVHSDLLENSFGHPQSMIPAGNLLKNSGIIMSDVCMRYDINAQDTLKNVTIHITPGSRVAITGRTGSGKSSLIRLLLRLNDYHSGSIALGGQELSKLSKQSLRRSIGVIPQNPLVFTGTIRFNLDPFKQFSNDQVISALERCRFYETTLASETGALNEGSISVGLSSFKTILTTSSRQTKSDYLQELLSFELVDGGSNLSFGQKQLICLGRVLLQKSELVLVDEATAAIDPVTEGILYDVLATQIKASGATLLMICHKQNGIEKICNKMLEIKDGSIVSYDDLY